MKKYIYRVLTCEFGYRWDATDFYTDREAAIKAVMPYISEVIADYGDSTKFDTIVSFLRDEGAWEGSDYEFHTECCVLEVDE